LIKEKWSTFSGPLMLGVLVFAMLYGKAMEDTYGGSRDSEETNFYDIMGLPRQTGIVDVRKKYKSLALTWHPDKNPDCKECPDKFAAISKAYETLSDVDAKKAYDNNRAAKGKFDSENSIDLTADDFEAKVLRSNEVWLVQVFEPSDGASSSFHPIWEEVSTTYKHVAKFGRIDLSKNKKATEFLPQRVVITPQVFRFARGEITDSFTWSGSRGDDESGGRAGAGLTKFIIDTYPALQKSNDASEVTSFWKKSDRSRLLISGNGKIIQRGAQNKQFFQILKEAHLWADYFDVTTADAKDCETGLKDFKVALPDADRKKGHPWSVTYVPAGVTSCLDSCVTVSTDDLKELPAKMETVVGQALMADAPYLTVRNHRQLCGATTSRKFCLVMVDMPNGKELNKVLEEVAASRAEYAKELADMKDNADGEQQVDEPFTIQAVRVTTSTSRWPSQPVSVGSSFNTAWAEVGYAQMFVVEVETQRVAAVKPAIVAQICQQIAYEDLKLKELPEDFHLARALPDPEVSLKRALFTKLSTPVGFVVAAVLMAAVSAVAPELELVTNLAGGGILLSLLLIAWPLAFRRVLSLGARV